MKNQNRLYLILALGVLFLSTSAIFARVINAPSHVIAFYRMLISGLLLLPAIITSKSIRAEIKSLSKRQIMLGLISGLFLASHYVLWFESLNYTSIASSTVLVTLQPIFAVLGGYLIYKEKVNRYAIFGIVISILGSVMIGWQDFQTSTAALYGDFLALTAAVLITGYFFVGKGLRMQLSVIPYSVLGYFSSSAVLLIYGLIQQTNMLEFSSQTWVQFIGMAVCSTLLGQMVINWVLRWLDTTTVSVFILSEVVWTIILSFIILNEIVTGKEVLGISVIMFGLMVYLMNGRIERRFSRQGLNKGALKEAYEEA